MIVSAWLRRALAPLLLIPLAACFSARPADVVPPGCGKDVDCKGARICIGGHCTEPAHATAAATDGGAPLAAAQQPIAAPQHDAGTVFPALGTVAAGAPLGASAMFHGDARHSGRSTYRAPTATPTHDVVAKTGGTVYSSPALALDGTAYFGSHDRSIRAASPDGAILWTRATGDLVWSAPALGPGGVVYVGSDDDRLYALDAKDGNVRWTFTAGPCRRAVGVGPEASRCDVDGVTVGPDGSVYFVADGIYGLKPDGTLRFRYALPTHCAGAPALASPGDGTLYAGCQDEKLYALNPDGTKRWEFHAGDDIDSAPAIGDDGTIYFGSDDTKVYAVSPAGELKWAVKTAGPVRSAPALAADGTIYVGSGDAGLYALHPNGTVAWIFKAADRIVSSPLVDDTGAILFGSQDDRLYAVEPDGRLRWSLLLGGDVDSTPALAADGTVVVGCDDGALHFLR